MLSPGFHSTGPSEANRTPAVTLMGVLLVAALLRLYHVTAPYVDLSAWRSLDYASIARNYSLVDNRLWYPRVDWAGSSGLVEVEFPILPWLVAQLYPLVGEQAWLGRAAGVAWGVLGLGYVYGLVRALVGRRAALLSVVVLGLNPLHLYFSRTFQPDIPMLTAMTAALYHFHQTLAQQTLSKPGPEGDAKGGWRWHAVATAAALGLAGCLKLTALFVGLPMVALLLVHRGWRGILRADVWLIAVAGIMPIVAWYSHAMNLYSISGFTVGILSGGHDKLQTLTYLSTREWWRVMLRERTVEWILTPAGIPLFLVGFVWLLWPRGEQRSVTGPSLLARVTLGAWWLAGVMFVLLVAEGNLDMPHYQLMLVLPSSVIIALGLDYCLTLWQRFPRLKSPVVNVAIVALTIFSLCGGSAYALRSAYENKRHDALAMAEAIQALEPTADLILDLGAYTEHKGGYDYEPMDFYYSGTRGWVLTPPEYTPEAVEQYRQQGASLLISRHPEQLDAYPALARFLREQHQVLRWTDKQVLVRLIPPRAAQTVGGHARNHGSYASPGDGR